MSVDFGLFAKALIHSLSPKEEKFVAPIDGASLNDVQVNDGNAWKFRVNVATFVSVIISPMLSVIAFILSWSCNTAMEYGVVVKSVFGAVAFVFGFTYIVMYLVFRWDVCMKIMK